MPLQVQLIIFAVIAAVVLFQLYRVLGKPIGRMPEDDAKAQGSAAPQGDPAKSDPAKAGPAMDAASLAAIAGLRARDPGFDPARFLDGARSAYETIVRAYGSGDRETLKPLLTPKVLAAFEAGIAARAATGDVDVVELVHPPRADLELATADGNRAIAKVRFLAELRTTTTPANGAEPSVSERRVAEQWTFERTLGAADPNWLLAGTQPAEA